MYISRRKLDYVYCCILSGYKFINNFAIFAIQTDLHLSLHNDKHLPLMRKLMIMRVDITTLNQGYKQSLHLILVGVM
ncbi:Uncharacterised protein [Enterobacter hormaechei]|nr:Uncharacterised protein [Enterobacter hormaechei]SAH59418.1 Uncharacterised protein [Enterobacter hormaechei]VAC22387.1 Uncharacterised protein [Enterobacter hormaechei]VAF38261.1 Uncharacterised protein [Enterobacter hormaechei]VAL76153.1 Uncharacterised protein [Enterobacter hormaechei]